MIPSTLDSYQRKKEENEKVVSDEEEKTEEKNQEKLNSEKNEFERVEAPIAPLLPITDLTPETFQMNYKGDKPILVKFSMSLCPDCAAFDSMYNELAFQQEKNRSLLVAQVDCTEQIEICDSQKIQNYRTIKLFFKNAEFEFKEKPFLNLLNAFVDSSIELVNKPPEVVPPEPGPPKVFRPFVLSLNPDNFDANIIQDKLVVVKFFSPRCIHCIHFAPTYLEFSQLYVEHPTVVIAEVDCIEHGGLCGRNRVQGYPTVKLFYKGDVQTFGGNRDVNNLSNWVDENLKK